MRALIIAFSLVWLSASVRQAEVETLPGGQFLPSLELQKVADLEKLWKQYKRQVLSDAIAKVSRGKFSCVVSKDSIFDGIYFHEGKLVDISDEVLRILLKDGISDRDLTNDGTGQKTAK
jgi:hypothetical protein